MEINTMKKITSDDYFKILISNNPNPSKGYVKNYGNLCRAEGALSQNPTSQSLIGTLDFNIEVCKIDIAAAISFGYDK
jgi:hypothetical protein